VCFHQHRLQSSDTGARRLFPFKNEGRKSAALAKHSVGVLKTLGALLGLLDDFPSAAK
jgi:hypothetical protein